MNEGTCAYLVMHLCQVVMSPRWYLDFPQLMKDLVRFTCYAVLRRYQEEVQLYVLHYIK
jgi:hypothetical protein